MVLAFLAFLPWSNAIINQFSVFHGYVWQEPPEFLRIIKLPYIFLSYLSFLLLLILGFFLGSRKRILIHEISNEYNLLVVIVSTLWVLIPFVIGIASKIGFFVYVERYFAISLIGYLLLATALLNLIYENKKGKIVLFCLAVFLYSVHIVNYEKDIYFNRSHLASQIDLVKKGSVIVCESPHQFFPLYYYTGIQNRKNIYLILDKNSALEKGSVKNEIFDYYWNMNLKKYYSHPNILEWNDFNKLLIPSFYLINERGRKCFEVEIEHNSLFSYKSVQDSLLWIMRKN